MCRLVGWVSRTPMSLVQALGEDGLADLIALSHHHADGWGVAWWRGDRLEVQRSPFPAHSSAEFSAAAHEVRSDAAIVHLRWATTGLPVTPENTHPFRTGDWAFAHNGSIRPASGLLDLLPTGTMLHGSTDSERLLHALLARRAELGKVPGLRQTVADVCADLTPTSLNSLLLGKDDLTAVCVHSDAADGPLSSDGPPEDRPGYFDLKWHQREGAVVVASEALGAAPWQSVGDGTALIVDRRTLDAESVDIGRFSVEAIARERARREIQG